MSCNPCSLGRCPDPKDYYTHDTAPYARSTNDLTSELRIRITDLFERISVE